MARRSDRAERLTNLLALLLESRVPLTAEDIFDELGHQYPDGDAARRQAFERDKATLRELGVPIEAAVLAGDDAGRSGYSIDRGHYELEQLDLDPDETQALQIAVAAIRSGTPVGTEALIKLGAGAAEVDVPVAANLPTLAGLPALRDAVARRRTVGFAYRGKARQLDPWGLLLRSGFWYVVGHDHGHDEPRTYRVDRIEGDVDVVDESSFERPDIDVSAMFPADPKQLGSSDATAVVRLSAMTGMVEHELGSDRVVARHDDGSISVEVPCANQAAFRSWVLGFLDRAEVVEPAAVRDDVIEWLTRTATGTDESRGGAVSGLLDDAQLDALRDDGIIADDAQPKRSAASRRTAEERVHRMLLMLPWLTERGEVTLDEVARRFETTPVEVEADITWVSLCGLPPFVDEMIDVFVDDGTVHVGVPRLFTRPLKLTAPEGFALLAAGRAAMALPGADPKGPLGRGLDKLADALGDDGSGLVLELDRPDNADELAEAVRQVERLEIRYWSPAREEVTTRVVTPRLMFTDRGYWYLAADDHGIGEQRTFRLDRIEAIRHLREHDEPVPEEQRAADTGSPTWFSDGAIPRTTLLLWPAASWVAERYPIDSLAEVTIDSTGETVRRVRLAVSSVRWLERLLVRLGPDAVVLEPPEWRDLAATTAQRILERYR